MQADYVIVGAGSAGCVLANRLSEDGSRVVLLEAGGRDWNPLIHVPAGYIKLLDHKTLTWGFIAEPDRFIAPQYPGMTQQLVTDLTASCSTPVSAPPYRP